MEDNDEIEIGPQTRANDIMRAYPETTDYFVELGICDCELDGAFGKLSMTKTLEEIAGEKNLPINEMIAKIMGRIKQ